MTRRLNPARCRHAFARHMNGVTGSGHAVHARRCWHCPTWLPLGPSNDAPPEVQQEIRAAEIAADSIGARMNMDEVFGWGDYDMLGDGDTDAWHAGYLARAIVEHEE